jgi:hypothetical protein
LESLRTLSGTHVRWLATRLQCKAETWDHQLIVGDEDPVSRRHSEARVFKKRSAILSELNSTSKGWAKGEKLTKKIKGTEATRKQKHSLHIS